MEMADQLVKNRNVVTRSFYGLKCLKNCRIEEYKRSKAEWIDKQKALETKKRLFDDLFQ